MEATALVLLAAAVGVNYGWQPMPDGSSRYEYIVQVDPDLLETLDSDHSIPLVSEVPEDVQPIGRIRVVVGRGEAPRQRLSTHLKPPSDGGIELTQYTEYGDPGSRYAQPQGAPASEASSWNGGDAPFATPASSAAARAPYPAATSPLPTAGGSPAAAGGSAWNEGPVSVAQRTDASGPMGRVGDSIDSATAPLRDGLGKVGDKMQSAASDLGDRTRGLVDDLSKPFQRQAPPATPGGTLPPAAAGAPASQWNGGASPVAEAPASRYQSQPQSWNDDPVAGTPPMSPPLPGSASFAAPGAGAAGRTAASATGGSQWNGDASQGTAERLDQPIDPRDVGQWDNKSSRTATSGGAAAGSPSGRTAQGIEAPPFVGGGDSRSGRADVSTAQNPTGTTRGAGPSLPADFPAVGPTFPLAGDAPGTAASGVASDARSILVDGAGGKPAITRGMLVQPADRPLDASSPAALDASVAPAFPSTAPFATPSDRSASGGKPNLAADQGWENESQRNPTGTLTQQTQNLADKFNAPGGTRQAMTALFAWVLLTGSAAGNLYLFWSYQDVRHKYRSLVRKTARAVGSRLSPA